MCERENTSAPFVAGLATATDHLTVDEVIEIGRGRGGEAELNDLLRHAVTRLVRPHLWIVEREVSDRSHRLSRVDLALTETSSDERLAWVEAKMLYATDAVESPTYFIGTIAKDAAKLRAGSSETPAFLLTWAFHLTHSAFQVRYGAGHVVDDDGWRTRLDVETCRAACGELLRQFGTSERVEVKSGTGDYGTITLDAWWTRLYPCTAA